MSEERPVGSGSDSRKYLLSMILLYKSQFQIWGWSPKYVVTIPIL